jgi:hypothetical protein
VNSQEIFDISLEVIALVEKRTKHLPTALRILKAAQQGFGEGFSVPQSLLQSRSEDVVYRP